jgi:hypothetical protein
MKIWVVVTVVIVVLFIYIVLKNRPQIAKNYNVIAHPKTSLDLSTLNSSTHHRPVYVYMSLDYPKLPKYGEYSIEIMKRYCESHGYTLSIFDHQNTSEMSPYWIRVNDMHKLLNETPKDSLIVYFDLDAIVHPDFFNIRLENIVNSLDKNTNSTWDIYAPVDPGPLNFEMNTGIIVARNTDWTRSFVNTWLSNYPKGFWKKDILTNKWSCTINKNRFNKCLWAGDEYEQGMFNRLYQRDVLNSQTHILPVDLSILGNSDPTKVSFTLHLMANTDETRLSFFKRYLQLIDSQEN